MSFLIKFKVVGIESDCVPFVVPFALDALFDLFSLLVVLIDEVFVVDVVFVVTEMVPLDVVTVDDVKLVEETTDAVGGVL